MRRGKVDFKTSNYFPAGLIFAGYVILFAALAALVTFNIVAGVILTFIGIAFITTHYRLEVDFESREYKDYVWFFGFKNGARAHFEKLDYIFIKQKKLSQNLNSLVSTRTISKDAFDGYLKIDGKETIHLLTKENKEHLKNRLGKIAAQLELQLIDHSQ